MTKWMLCFSKNKYAKTTCHTLRLSIRSLRTLNNGENCFLELVLWSVVNAISCFCCCLSLKNLIDEHDLRLQILMLCMVWLSNLPTQNICILHSEYEIEPLTHCTFKWNTHHADSIFIHTLECVCMFPLHRTPEQIGWLFSASTHFYYMSYLQGKQIKIICLFT